MAVDSAALIRAGSGVVFVAVGLITWWATRGSPRPGGGALATFCVTFGAGFVAVNFLGYDPRTGLVGVALESGLWAVATAALVALVWNGPWTRVGRREVKVGLVVALVYAILLDVLVWPWLDGIITSQGFAVAPGGIGRALGLSFGPLFAAAGLVTVLAAREAARTADADLRAGLALLSVGLFAFTGHTLGAMAAGVGAAGGLGLAVFCLATIVAVAAPWLVLGGGGRWVAWTILAGAAYGEAEVFFGLFGGSVGVIRTLAAAAIAVAVLRKGLFGTTRSARNVERGSLAAGALAVLFIVAQVAQNFFSASYGLLTGGVVAGAFLFAAQPLQRAMERIAVGRDVLAPATSPARDDAAGEALYRDTLRMALKDQRVSAEEEQHLAELGERLGLSARRAVALRHEVEREKGVR